MQNKQASAKQKLNIVLRLSEVSTVIFISQASVEYQLTMVSS